jgi:hypothetical protein
MKTFLLVLAAVVLTILVAIPAHYAKTERLRLTILFTTQKIDELNDQLYFYKGKEADANRQPRYAAPKYRNLVEKRLKK